MYAKLDYPKMKWHVATSGASGGQGHIIPNKVGRSIIPRWSHTPRLVQISIDAQEICSTQGHKAKDTAYRMDWRTDRPIHII